ncbi:MAG: hypothetical protein AB1758_12275 [Candidatus Eremiobacterota bacterium]
MTELLIGLGAVYGAVSVLGYTATLSHGTRWRLACAGALMGFTVVPLVSLAVNPQGGPDALATLATLGALCCPGLAMLASRHRLRFSVADGFLLGFMVGLGFDAVAGILELLAGNSLRVSLFPPCLRLEGRWWAGYGYWCGLVTMLAVAGRRFAAVPSWSNVWIAVAMAWAAADRLTPQAYAALGVEGRSLPFLTLGLLVLLGEYEANWLLRSPAYRSLSALPELRVPPLRLSGGLRGWLERSAVSRYARQVLLERTEMIKLGYTTFSPVAPPVILQSGPDFPRLALATAAWLAVLTSPAWLKPPSGALAVPLVIALVWLYLRFPELEPDEADGATRVRFEELALNLSLLLILLLGLTEPFMRETPQVSRPAALPTFALLLAVAAGSLTGSRRAEWIAFLTAEQRRLGLIHRAIALAKTALVGLGCAGLFAPWYRLLKGPLGGALPAWALLPVSVLALAAVAGLAARFINRAGDAVERALKVRAAP